MAFKNRKSNYPLYETTHFKDLREMTENVANRYPDKVAFRYKKNPRDKEVLTYTYEESRVYVRSIATEFIAMGLTGEKVDFRFVPAHAHRKLRWTCTSC